MTKTAENQFSCNDGVVAPQLAEKSRGPHTGATRDGSSATSVEGGITLTRTLAKRLSDADVNHAFTGSAGAYFVDPAAGFCIVVVYVDGDARSALADLSMRPVESGENVWLVTPADEGVFYRTADRDVGRVRTVCLPQLYADLRDLPERSAEMATVLKARGLWEMSA